MKAAGNIGCPCSNVTSTLSSDSDERNFCTTHKNETGVQQIKIGGTCLPFSYGSSRCYQHDLINDPICHVDNEEGDTIVPAFCFRPWCFVDVDKCKRDSTERVFLSSYFPSAKVYYSYSTCNSTDEDWWAHENSQILGGISISASVPTYQVPVMYKSLDGEPLNTVGSEYYDNSIGYEGVYPDYIKNVISVSNGDILNVSYTYR